jgi:hypothetical protein
MLYTNVDYTQEYADQRTRTSEITPDIVSSSWETRAKAKVDGSAGGFSNGMIHTF